MNFARAGLAAAGLERVPSDALSKDYKRRIAAERTPVSASIELTYRCNLHCGHCYCPPGDRSRELTGDEIRALIDRLAELGTLFLQILPRAVPTRERARDAHHGIHERHPD